MKIVTAPRKNGSHHVTRVFATTGDVYGHHVNQCDTHGDKSNDTYLGNSTVQLSEGDIVDVVTAETRFVVERKHSGGHDLVERHNIAAYAIERARSLNAGNHIANEGYRVRDRVTDAILSLVYVKINAHTLTSDEIETMKSALRESRGEHALSLLARLNAGMSAP